MRVVELTRHGGPEVLQVAERPDTWPGASEVLIDVRAAGVNFADLMARVGLYPDGPKPPCVLGYEVAGVVTEIGDDVEGLARGDRVMAGSRFGGYADRIVVPSNDVVPLPAELSFEQGAAIPVAYATALAALERFGSLRAGERVLIHAAAGGVGVSATQLAKRGGAEVWGTSSPAKHDAIRANGVDHALDYTRDGWERDVPPLDLVLDAIGGRSFRRSYGLLRPGGRLVCFGASAVVSGARRNLVAAGRTALSMPRFNLIHQMSESKAVIGLNMLRLFDEFGAGTWIAPLRERIDDGTIRPIVAAAVPFDNAPEAHLILTERRNVGKVVLVP